MASRGVNKVILVGNLGADPETRYMPNGDAVTNVNIATSETWKDKNTGEQQERTEWHRIIFWRKLAEIASQYLRKGSKVYIEGRLQTRKWQGQDGQDRYTTEIVANEMQMLDSRGGSGGNFQNAGGDFQSGNAPPQAAAAAASFDQPPAAAPAPAGRSSQAAAVNDDFDDDIPF